MSFLNSLFIRPLDYLDPGSGSMIIQMVIAAALGLGVVIRVFWKNIKAFFTGKKVSEEVVDDPTTITDDDQITLPPLEE